MLEWIRRALMVRLHECRDKIVGYQGPLCPKIQKKVEKKKMNSRFWTSLWSGGAQFEVRSAVDGFFVNLEARTCTCYKWDLDRNTM